MKHAPFTVYLSTNASVCSGVILDRSTILTAAHCLSELQRVDDIYIVYGSTDKKQFPAQTRLKVKSFIIHPQYDNTTLANDVAIIKLQNYIEFNKNVDRISIYYDDVEPGIDAYVTGWGLNPDGVLSQTIRTLKVNVYPDAECTRKFGKDFNGLKQICAGTLKQDFCIGDSGGPLIIHKNTIPYLIGIVSYTGEQCSDGRPSVYTKMKTYRLFIEKYLD